MIKKFIPLILMFLLVPVPAMAETLDLSEFSNKTVYFGGELYLPVCETLEACGFDVSWGKGDKAYTAVKGDFSAKLSVNSGVLEICGEKKSFQKKTAFRNNRLYMPKTMAEELCKGFELYCPQKITDFSVGDDFCGKTAEKVGDMYLCDSGFIFKPYRISSSGIGEYADIVNRIAEKMKGVRTFLMPVPEGSEFYAPKSLKSGQGESFTRLSGFLSDSVKLVNVCPELYAHAAEKLYFNTDHHWTHRGAYYAYNAFAETAGGSVFALSELQSRDFYSYVGSYNGIGVATPEILERFMPPGENKGYIYSGSSVSSEKHEIQIVNPSDNTYNCFIGGDNGLVELCGNAKNGKKLCIVKESFGNALSTFAVQGYERVYVVDIRRFGGTLSALYAETGFDDLLIESYAESIGSRDLRSCLKRISR